jgi:hypothetical protein
MLGVEGRPVAFNNMVMPLQAHGVKVISIGFFIDEEKPVIWRGPMLHRALQQFLADVHWGELDFLLCDLPPGTGDIAISLAQMLPNADMLVVTTPQQAAQRVALRAGQMTAQTGMRVMGVVENMATFVAPDTGKEYRIFGEGGGQLLAAELDTEVWAQIPIDPRLRAGSDAGVPLVVSDPDAPASQRIIEVATRMAKQKSSLTRDTAGRAVGTGPTNPLDDDQRTRQGHADDDTGQDQVRHQVQRQAEQQAGECPQDLVATRGGGRRLWHGGPFGGRSAVCDVRCRSGTPAAAAPPGRGDMTSTSTVRWSPPDMVRSYQCRRPVSPGSGRRTRPRRPACRRPPVRWWCAAPPGCHRRSG